MNRKYFRIVLTVLTFMSLYNLTSCSSSKKASRKNKKAGATVVTVIRTDTANVVNNEPITGAKKELVDKYAPVWKKEVDFKTFSGKAKCHYEGKGQNHDITVNIRVRKNEAAWIMATAFGGIVQVARLYITPDSFQMINYLENSYLSMKTSEANNVLPFPVDFSMLQNLFVGNALRTDGDVKDVQDAADVVSMIIKKDNLNQDIFISKIANTISAMRIYLDNNNSEATIKYNGYQTKDGRNFPTDRLVNVSSNGEQHLLEMNFSDASFDKNVDMPFSVPKNFSKK